MIASESELSSVFSEVQKRFAGRDVLLLFGPVGVGKTTFVKAALAEMGCSDAHSPTFALHNEYETNIGVVDHLDLYRVESEEELESIGFWDLLAKPKGLIIVEWAERLPPGSLPKAWNQIKLTFEKGEGLSERKIQLDKC